MRCKEDHMSHYMGAYSWYTTLNQTKYIQGCFNNVNRTIPVTIFIMMVYNACFTYQEDKSTNLLISALDGFDMVSSIDDDTFMNSFSELPRRHHIFKWNWKFQSLVFKSSLSGIFSNLELNDLVWWNYIWHSPKSLQFIFQVDFLGMFMMLHKSLQQKLQRNLSMELIEATA